MFESITVYNPLNSFQLVTTVGLNNSFGIDQENGKDKGNAMT